MKLRTFAILLLLIPASASALTDNLLSVEDVPEFQIIPASPDIIRQLRQGGFVLYIRHGATDTSRPDRLPNVDLNDCATQRPLTEDGRQQMKLIGRQIRKARIPIGDVITSPMCRTKESALAAFGPNYTVNNQLKFTSNMLDADKAPVLDATRELLSSPVTGKLNRVVVGHSQNLMELIGYMPKPEGVMAIFKPLGDRHFKYVATILPTQWKTLLTQSGE